MRLFAGQRFLGVGDGAAQGEPANLHPASRGQSLAVRNRPDK
jgi:hypothetical protein